MRSLKIWYSNLSEKKQLAFTISILFLYWFFAWLFFEKMVWKGSRPLWFGGFFALCISIGLTILFQWNKIRRVFGKSDN